MNRLVVVPILVLSLALPGCSSDEPKTTGSSTKLGDKFKQMSANLGATIARLKPSATTATDDSPADLAEVARIPPNVIGGVDIAAEQSGKIGDFSADMDGVGSEEAVTCFVPDPPSGTGTSASLPSYIAWRGDADSGDEGLCYLAWTKGASWFVVSRCKDATGAWVCQVTADEAVCRACSNAGQCSPCDMEQTSFTCRW